MARRLTAAGLLLMGALAMSGTAAAEEAASKVLTILNAENAETQGMALVLANQAARQDAEVHVLLCGPAGDIALAEPPAAATEVITPKGMSVRSLLEALMDKGARVDVCAIYLPNRELSAGALLDGVGVAKPPEIAAEMLASDTKVFTY